MGYKTISTSAEVVAVIRAKHGDALVLFDTFSDPCGEFTCGTTGRMETSYAIKSTDFPIIKLCTTWEIDQSGKDFRFNETTTYWLCVATEF